MIYYYVFLAVAVVFVILYLVKIKKVEFVSFAGKWWKLYSAWTKLLGVALIALSNFDPSTVFAIWNSIPPDIKQFIPPQFTQGLGIALIIISFFAQFVRQMKIAKKGDSENDPNR